MSSYVDADVLAIVIVRGNNIQPAEVFAAEQTFIETPVSGMVLCLEAA